MELNKNHRERTVQSINDAIVNIHTGVCQIDMIYTDGKGQKSIVSLHPVSVDVQYESDPGGYPGRYKESKYTITAYVV